MQVFLTDRAGWLWGFAAAAIGVSMAMWWQPRVDTPAATAPVAVAAPAPARQVAASTVVGATPLASPLPASAPALTLVGTVLAGASSFATVRRTSDSQLLQLRVGDRIDGLAVSAIESDRVVLGGGARPVVVEADPAAIAAAPAPLPRRVDPPAGPPVEQPKWPEGEAPWDLVPPFKH